MRRVVFIRHAEPRRGESDPELTSRGHRQARDTALWLDRQGWTPSTILCTPTARTRQTAQELSLVCPDAVLGEIRNLLEGIDDWYDAVSRHHPGDGVLAIVGHHPTTVMLLHKTGPPPDPVSAHRFATALCLVQDADNDWQITAAWPGAPL